jgi:Acetyltransferase (GNAT) domain
MPAEQESITIRTYAPGDETAVLDLFRRAFGVQREMEHWRWEFEQNPFGNHNITVAFDRDERLVAYFGSYSVPFRDHGRDLMAYQMCDVMTDPSVRHIGRGPTNVFVRCMRHFYETFSEGKIAFDYGFDTGSGQVLFFRYLRGQLVEPVAYRLRDLAVHPIRPANRIARRLRGYQFQLVRQATAEWDDLFERAAPDYGFLVRRDRAYFQWRYLDCPDIPYLVVAVRRWGCLAGWVVFRIRDDRFTLGDALFDRRYAGAFEVVLRHVVPQYRVRLLEGWFPSRPLWFSSILDDCGMQRRDEPQGLSMIAATFMLPDAVERLRESYYTMGDGDLF